MITNNNEVRNILFYFIKGNLKGSEILRQFLHVVMCLSMIDITVCGLSLDAGGNNARLVRYLLRGENHVINGWLPVVLFLNFFSPIKCPIFIWYCTTHMLKSCRNQLMASQPKEKCGRDFHNIKNIYFGWQSVINQWNAEVKKWN